MKKRAFVLLGVFCFFLLLFSPACKADAAPCFTFRLEKSPAYGGDTVRLCVDANRMDDPAAGFRVRVSYDGGFFEYEGTETSSRIGSGTFRVNPDGNPIYGVYVCDTQKGYAPSLSGNIISFVFRVRDGAKKTKTSLSVCVDQICDFSAEQLNLTCSGELPLRIESGPSCEAALDSLEPFGGALEPEFSPEVYFYTMRVGYDVDSVEFRADAAGRGTVKISRKTLNRAGSATRIVATVTAEDGKTKSRYTVTVYRAPKPASSSGAGSRAAAAGVTLAGPGKETQSGLPPGRESEDERESGGSRSERGNSDDPQRASSSGGNSSAPRQENSGEAVAEQPAAAVTRNLYFIGNRMPEYLVGMLACALCIVTGIALCLFLGIRPKK